MSKQLLCNIDSVMDGLTIKFELESNLRQHYPINCFTNNTFLLLDKPKKEISELDVPRILRNFDIIDVIDYLREDMFSVEKLNDECLILTNYDEEHDEIGKLYIYNLTSAGEYELEMVDNSDYKHTYDFLKINPQHFWQKIKTNENNWGKF
jgi:hypothetical protein